MAYYAGYPNQVEGTVGMNEQPIIMAQDPTIQPTNINNDYNSYYNNIANDAVNPAVPMNNENVSNYNDGGLDYKEERGALEENYTT